MKENKVNNKIPMTVIELFSGIGAQIRGINNTNLFNTKVMATSDIDKEATVSYAAIHDNLTPELIKAYGEYPSETEMKEELISKNIGINLKKGTNPIARLKGDKLKKYYLAMKLSNNLGDITKIEKLPYADLWTYSFPCQDISIAGKQEGIVKSKTRSGLLFEVERLLEKAKEKGTLPKYLLLENVKNLTSKNFIVYLEEWISRLEDFGYNTYWQVINAKNCGIPQNRERVFAISIRKDVDMELFEFPQPFDLGFRIRDFLEYNVDEKYYLNQEIQDRLKIIDKTLAKSIIGATKPKTRRIGTRDLVYSTNSYIGCLVATDYKQPKQILEIPNELIQVMTLNGGKWDKEYDSNRRVYSENGIIPTICTCQKPKIVFEEQKEGKAKLKVRKITPNEAWRLMGFTDEDYKKAVDIGLSDSSGYKQAGNSIVTNCIELIIEHLYKAQYDNTYVCKDEIFSEIEKQKEV